MNETRTYIQLKYNLPCTTLNDFTQLPEEMLICTNSWWFDFNMRHWDSNVPLYMFSRCSMMDDDTKDIFDFALEGILAEYHEKGTISTINIDNLVDILEMGNYA